MLWWIIGILVVVLFASMASPPTTIEPYDPKQRLNSSFAERYEDTEYIYQQLDASNKDLNQQKEVGPNVTDSTHTNGLLNDYDDPLPSPRPRLSTNNQYSWEYQRQRLPENSSSGNDNWVNHKYYYNDSDWNGGGDWANRNTMASSSSSQSRGNGELCERMNFFVMKESAMANMMATQFTAEQKLQLQTFMNAINKYVSYIQLKRPSDASMILRQVVANSKSSMVDALMEFAQRTAKEDVESQTLLRTYGPIQVNPNMNAYIHAVLLMNDMTMTHASMC
jgi:hypothetical protein